MFPDLEIASDLEAMGEPLHVLLVVLDGLVALELLEPGTEGTADHTLCIKLICIICDKKISK